MSLHEYTGILIKGYLENRDNLVKYLIRESKKAEREYIDNEEFFDGLNKVIKLFHIDIENQYYKRKNDVSTIKSIKEEKGQSIEDLEDQVFPKENYNVFLPRVTGNRFIGNLSIYEIQFLEIAINEAKQNLNHDGKSQSGTASKGKIIYNENDTIILSVETIKALHEFCKENDFFKSEFEYSDFFNCFNLSKRINVYPEFNHSYQTKFVFLIQDLVNLTNDKAKERFNISSYSNIIQRNKDDDKSPELKVKMKAFIRKHKPGINNN